MEKRTLQAIGDRRVQRVSDENHWNDLEVMNIHRNLVISTGEIISKLAINTRRVQLI